MKVNGPNAMPAFHAACEMKQCLGLKMKTVGKKLQQPAEVSGTVSLSFSFSVYSVEKQDKE